MASKSVKLFGVFLFVLIFVCFSHAQLSTTFYDSSCPNVQTIVRSTMKQAVSKEKRMGASILRLFFHDCFVNGCDGSILLKDTATFQGEQTVPANNNSARGFQVIDTIKSNVEASCNQTVSCADILALAARDGVVLLGGPSWKVPLGRRDATRASFNTARNNLPPPFSSLSNLTTLFSRQGLTPNEMTVLSGAHTIGQARCVSFRPHIYNDTDIDANFANTRQANCPFTTNGVGDDNLAPFDISSPTKFDNGYYKNLVAKRGLLHSDQELFNGGSQDSLVKNYNNNNAAFLKDFVAAMIKMGNISPLTGTKGEIRNNCAFIN